MQSNLRYVPGSCRQRRPSPPAVSLQPPTAPVVSEPLTVSLTDEEVAELEDLRAEKKHATALMEASKVYFETAVAVQNATREEAKSVARERQRISLETQIITRTNELVKLETPGPSEPSAPSNAGVTPDTPSVVVPPVEKKKKAVRVSQGTLRSLTERLTRPTAASAAHASTSSPVASRKVEPVATPVARRQ